MDAQIEGAALIGITVRKNADFSAWYQQVLIKGDMVCKLASICV
jgi:prolyl-tRNA synthetase